MWAYLAAGGLYESLDGGRTWLQAFAGHLPFITAVRPAGSLRLIGIDPSTGLASSVDGGRTWTPDSVPPTAPIQSLAATGDGRIVLIGGPRGVFRSDDGGQSWQKTGLEVSTLAIAASDDVAALPPSAERRSSTAPMTAGRRGVDRLGDEAHGSPCPAAYG